MEEKIKYLYEISGTIPYIAFYFHEQQDMYKIDNLFTKYNKETHVLSPVSLGFEHAVDLAIELFNKIEKAV